MNPFVSRITHNSWVMPVSAMCVVLGFMIAMARVTGDARPTRLPLTGADQQNRIASGPIDLQESYTKLQSEVESLRAEKTRMENALASQTGSTKVLNDNLQEAKVFASLTEVAGPGIVVTLRDSPKRRTDIPENDQVIHDVDTLRVVNELFAAGAEAISVNNHRLAATSSIRCVGPVIHIDSVPIASPVIIRAIGDPKTLSGGVNIPFGILDELRSSDPGMVQVELVEQMRLPAYSGPTTRRHAQVPEAKP